MERFGAHFGSQNGPKRGSQTELDFRPIFEAPLGNPEIKVIPPREANAPVDGKRDFVPIVVAFIAEG